MEIDTLIQQRKSELKAAFVAHLKTREAAQDVGRTQRHGSLRCSQRRTRATAQEKILILAYYVGRAPTPVTFPVALSFSRIDKYLRRKVLSSVIQARTR